MRKITIIGAGQAGLQLGIGLIKSGYEVSLYTNRTAQQLLAANVLSSPVLFNSALQLERELGLNFWDDKLPLSNTITFRIYQQSGSQALINFSGKTSQPYQAIDQRLKFSRWLNEFEKRGGKLIIQNLDVKNLDEIAAKNDLTIVAGGKSEISRLFPVNKIRSHFDSPQRVLACLYVKGLLVPENDGIHANVITGVGECFITPGLTFNGPCHMLLFEGLPGGAFDCWRNITCANQVLEKAIELLKNFIPWELTRCKNIILADKKATLMGSYTPIIRHPSYQLPNGQSVLGLGDTLVLNDPIGGQGANTASKAAKLYLDEIKKQGTKKFSEVWMNEVFEKHWQQSACWATKWTELLLKPPTPAFLTLLKKATHTPYLSNKVVDIFDNPSILPNLINF